MRSLFLRYGNSAEACWEVHHLLCICGRLVSRSPLLCLPLVYLPQEGLRLVVNIGVRCRETLTVQYFEFTEHVDEATEYREHVCSIAMRATELHADSLVQMSDDTTTFIHSSPH